MSPAPPLRRGVEPPTRPRRLHRHQQNQPETLRPHPLIPALNPQENPVPQTPERRMYLYWKALRHNREYRRGLAKGYNPSPLMMVARRFGKPIREVRDVLDAQKGPRT